MSTSELSRDARARGRHGWSVLGIAWVVGAHAGVIDIALALPERPSGLTSFLALCPPVIATALFFALLYLATWAGVATVARRGASSGEPLQVSWGAFILAGFVLASWGDLVRWPSAPSALFELALVVLAAALFAVSVFFAWRELERSPRRRARAVALTLASPFLGLQFVIAAWAQLYHVETIFSLAALGVACLLIAGLVGTTYVFLRQPRAAVVAWTIALLAIPLVLVVSTHLLAFVHNTPSTAQRDVRHVVLITSDALRADALSSYDSTSPSSPRLDELASDGVLFERAYSSAPWTLASLASVLTGLSPTVHTLTDIKARLPDEIPTLAELMGRAGYHTGAIVLNDLLRRQANLDGGFDDYLFLTEPSFGRSFGAALLQRALPFWFPSPPWPRTEDITEIALGWVTSHRDRDFFLWIHYYDPHAPYTPRPRFLPGVSPPSGMTMEFYGQKDVTAGFAIPVEAERQWIEALYRAEVRSLDEGIGSFLDGLRRLGLYDESLIVFTSDHGEEFWDHGAHGHGHTLYDELLAVPLIVKPPAVSGVPRRVAARVSSEAVTPTVLELCGLDFDPERYTAASLAPLVLADHREGELATPPITSTSSVLFDRKESVIFDDLKYVRSMIGDSEELFDLNADPEENASLAAARPTELAKARRLLEAHEAASQVLRAHYGVVGTEEVVLDEDTLRKLRGLGYVQ